ncbi:transcriptional regulator, IclR family [Actinacidiphila guanduensis]|jgi:DNA-binding IclR family transcriptional regulator|uniref:Transcriptional regulator, IclR family n=1 Tax=Actinacidiphila guanduensis TaxID=310781 RepID=A0A1H0GEX9_9ACTN|nr:transcriptional regulator, IclR family [Actinacidiphila guanduensis]
MPQTVLPRGVTVALEYQHLGPGVQAVQYALRVLESVDAHRDGVTAEQLSREIGVPPGQLKQVLAMLRRERYLGFVPGGGYVVGESLVLLGAAHRDAALAERLREVLTELRDEVGAAVYFSRYDDGEVRIVDFADGPNAPKVNEWVDFRSAAHASAVGKCLLSQLDHNGRREHLSRHRPARLTSRTEVDDRVLLTKLERQPATVPTLDLQEYAVGTVCAAIPVTIGKTVACLALSMPYAQAHRLRPAVDTLHERAAPVLLTMSI